MRKIAIVGAVAPSSKFIPQIKSCEIIIGVDRGSYWLIRNNIFPNFATGDFDSVTKKEFETIKKGIKSVKAFSNEKDQTDLELAIDESIKLKPDEVFIYGVTGQRLDHTLAAFKLLNKFLTKKIFAKIKDEGHEIFLIDEDISIKKSREFYYLSIFSFSPQSSITLTGFKYNIEKKHLVLGDTLGISNEIVKNEGRIAVHKGILLIIRSKK